MKIILIHLSDLHFAPKENKVTDRVDAIRGAAMGTAPDASAYLVMVTGDIANSGKGPEYSAAVDFFLKLRDQLVASQADVQVSFVFVPGNHDCDFSSADSVRQMVIDSVIQDPLTLASQDTSVMTKCVGVQDAFFQFEALFSESELHGDARLYYERQATCNDKTVRFHCYNTAWMSQLHEQQGKLIYPVHVPQRKDETADLTVSLLHHPFNWFESNNARTFQKDLENTSDIILTGHEHVSDLFRKYDSKDRRTDYIAGAVLQQKDPGSSGFNVLVIDFDGKRYMSVPHIWSRDMYLPDSQRHWLPFISAVKTPNAFVITEEFEQELADCGAAFSHPAKRTLSLYDVFVYPDLDNLAHDGGETDDTPIISGNSIVKFVSKYSHVLITGAERAGKTSLGKILYGELHKNAVVPVLLSGRILKRTNDMDSLLNAVDAAVLQQYGKLQIERYRQLDRRSKTVIVDDFDQCQLNRRGQNLIASLLEDVFDKVIVFANDLFQFQELTTSGGDESKLLFYRQCAIREFGHRLRGKLIEKWMTLGHELDSEEREIEHKVADAEHQITVLIGKSLIPSHPLFLLTMLQAYEAQTNLKTASGSYGYYYEVLITAALHNKTNEITLDTFYTLTSRIAYRMFSAKTKTLREAEFEQVIDEYQAKYAMRFSRETLIRVLEEARMIRQDAEGQFIFQYKYIYYYFVARYLADNLHSSAHSTELRQQISEMVSKLYVEDFANIIIFLVYLTKDERTIAELVAHAKTLYQECEPCDLQQHLGFAHTLLGETPPVKLVTDGNAWEKHRQRLDDMDEKKEAAERQENERRRIDAEAEEAIRFNVGFKTLQIIGQILRNFPGALPGDVKREIATESYRLGLRMLRWLMGVLEENLGEFKQFFAAALKSERERSRSEPLDQASALLEARDIAAKVDAFIFYLSVGVVHGMVKKMSQAVGSEHLKETYREVDISISPIAIGLINLSIKLDHFQAFPESEIKDINKEIRKDKFLSTVLRRLVRDYLYLFPLKHELMQKMCDELGISYDAPKMLGRTDKRR